MAWSPLLDSRAYSKLCERCSGIDLGQMSMMTARQFQSLIEGLALRQGEKVLDVGCGAGKIANTIAGKTGAHVLAIDKEPELVFYATQAFGKQVDFQEMDFDHIPWVGRAFDAIYAIDTLYFAENLDALVRKLFQLLSNGGRLAVFWSQMLPKGADRTCLEPEHTFFGSSLGKLSLTFTTVDYTEEERRFWSDCKTALADLEEEFTEEGLGILHKNLSEEASQLVDMFSDDRVRRYFYLVRKFVP